VNLVATWFKEQSFKTTGESSDDEANTETTKHVWELKEIMDQQLKEKEEYNFLQ
jgi:hypothetical protein